MFSVWSNSSNKAKKIEVVMNQIKSTKRLTFDDFQAFTMFAVGYMLRERKKHIKNSVVFMKMVVASVPSSKNEFVPTFDSFDYVFLNAPNESN